MSVRVKRTPYALGAWRGGIVTPLGSYFGIEHSRRLGLWILAGRGFAPGNAQMIATSPTGESGTWTQRQSHNGNAGQDWRAVCDSPEQGVLHMVAETFFGAGSTFQAQTSPNGIVWTGENLPWDVSAVANTQWVDVINIPAPHGRALAIGVLGTHANNLATKKPGEGNGPGNWTGRGGAPAVSWLGGCFSRPLDRAIVVGVGPHIGYSNDGGLTWQQNLNALPANTWCKPVWVDFLDMFVACALDGAQRIAFSRTGVGVWRTVTVPLKQWRFIEASTEQRRIVCVSLDDGSVMTSRNALSWKLLTKPAPAGYQFTALKWATGGGANKFLAASRTGAVGRVAIANAL